MRLIKPGNRNRPRVPKEGLLFPFDREVVLPDANRAEPCKIWKARAFIREHYCEHLSLRDVATAVDICPTYLSERFKEVTGVSFVSSIAMLRLKKARELLSQTDHLRVGEVAFAVGFQSLSQFNRTFKRSCNQSPTDFRQAHIKHRHPDCSKERNRNGR